MIGKVIGNYQITGELARGGMGTVFRGHHLNLPREVVVKAISLSSFPPQSQEHLKARFLREARVQSQLDHPNIVRVYEFFTTTENYYLVMEYVAGMSLRDLIDRQGAIGPAQAVYLFKQALAALDYAHNFSYVDESNHPRTGLIHRDIKPGNLLLDGRARLKITDFGIVKLVGERGMTQVGFQPGTIEYSSPEQLRGLEVDVRSDLYSLGVAFYETLAGRLPFQPSDTGSDYDVRKGHVEIDPPPITQSQPGVPAALAAVVMRSLAKNPAERFQSAAEFLDALLEYERQSDPVERTAPNPVERTAPNHPAPVTHSQTDFLTGAIPAAPRTSETTSPSVVQSPVAPAATPEVKPTQPFTVASGHHVPVQAEPQPRRYGLLVAGFVTIVLVIAATVAYVFLRPNTQGPDIVASTPTPERTGATPGLSPPPASPVAAENPLLNQAREQEQQENYIEAIKLYQSYLNGNPQAANHQQVMAHQEGLKKFQGLLTIARLEMDKEDYRQAQRSYDEALKLRPDSKLARAGSEEAKAKLAGRSTSSASRTP